MASPRRTASQIPLSLAKAKYIAESKEFSNKVSEIVKSINDAKSEQSEMFLKMTANPRLAVSFLMKNKTWINDEKFFIAEITDNARYSGFKNLDCNSE